MVSGRAVSRAGIGGALACLLLLTGFLRLMGISEAPVGRGDLRVDLLSPSLVLPALFAFLVVAVVGLFLERAERRPGPAPASVDEEPIEKP